MGRWSQARRRGGTPRASLDPTIVVVANIDTERAVVSWSAAVAIVGVAPDGNFTINGIPLTSIAFLSPTDTLVTSTGAGWTPGDGWSMPAQPNWVTTPVQVPESGTVA